MGGGEGAKSSYVRTRRKVLYMKSPLTNDTPNALTDRRTNYMPLEDLANLDGSTEVERRSVKSCYEDGVCPDCGEDIPDDAVEGQECENCGHVFCYETEDDDA